MNLERIFKNLIILALVVAVAMIVGLPDDPQYMEQPFTALEIVGLVTGILVLPSLILLYIFSPPGKNIFTILVVLNTGISFMLPEGYVPNGSVVDTLNWISGVITGAILTMLYLTKIKERFVKQK
jgi:membrane associated rhomboid family serine protease|tara:strand:+ start:264 stop:638 length:375 start_codon:yes stop_codon:yes gene_type:complete